MLRPIEGREPVFGAVTGAGGQFLLTNIQAGSYRLHIERDGYVDQQYGQVSSNRPGTVLVLVLGQQVQDVLVSLAPTGTISGCLCDEDGEPIVGASERAFQDTDFVGLYEDFGERIEIEQSGHSQVQPQLIPAG